MWEKIVLNLLSNAFKHTFEGEVVVQLRQETGSVVLSVRDTGVGIPADELPRVFERFHQVPSARSRTHEGSGIGLSLVRELARLHGGDVTVTSVLHQGSTFEVTLPLGHAHLPPQHVVHDRVDPPGHAIDDPVIVPYVREASRWEDGDKVDPATVAVDCVESGALAGAGIMVVDDNADMREYVTRLLAAAGADVRQARHGRDALAQLREPGDKPDIVLSDVMMPELDGFGLLAEMRADSELKNIPFIVLSARAGEESRVGGISAGADDYLVKPFVARELIARVAGQLRLARASRAERVARSDAEAARRQMSAILEQAPLPICVIEGPELLYTSANAYYRQIIGNRDPVGKTLLELWPELDGSAIHDVFRRVLTTGTAHSATEHKVHFDQFGTGEKRDAYFNFVYHPLHDATGATTAIIAIAIDVTPQVMARRESERLRQAAEGANEAKLHLLRTVSHETRQPVHASLGYLDLLLLGIRGALTDEQRRDLENIRRNQAHLLRLLNDILSFAKLEAGVLELDLEDVNESHVIAALEPLLRPQFEAKRVEYLASAQGGGAIFHGDRERTIQICVNLLTNALKATDPGGRVSITSGRRDGRVEFSVTDTGTGIPAEKLESIFEPFTMLARRPAPDLGGVGLGLSISRQLARAMRGDVTVMSTVGQGSTFTLSLPLHR